MKKSGFILVVGSYLVRKGLVSLLNQIPGVVTLHEFQDTHSLTDYLSLHSVDFILISQSLFDVSSGLFTQNPVLLEKVILLKDARSDHDVPDSKQDPAYTVINLDDEKERIISAIRGLLDHEGAAQPENPNSPLSPRETTILRLISTGLTNRQIADSLFLSAHTVMTHRKNISGKLGIKSVSGLTVYAIVNNIITIEEVSSLPKE